jgi:hypothetical protein
MNGADLLRGVVAAFPYAVHTVLTDNGMAFADLPRNRLCWTTGGQGSALDPPGPEAPDRTRTVPRAPSGASCCRREESGFQGLHA